MKTLAVLFALSSVALAADPLKPLLGTWKGKHEEKRGWIGETYDTRISGKPRPDGGVRLTETTSAGHVFKYTFYKSGKFIEQGIFSKIHIIDTYTGTWKAAGGKIIVTSQGTAGRFSGTFDATSTKLAFKGHAGPVGVAIKTRR